MNLTAQVCGFCGESFEYILYRKPRKFCSELCSQRSRSGSGLRVGSCDWCGAETIYGDGRLGRPKRWCSKQCKRDAEGWAQAVDRRSRVGLAECGWCCEPFVHARSDQAFCSKKCHGAANNHRQLWGDQLCCAVPFCACGRQILHDVGVSRALPPRAKMCRECRAQARREHDVQRGRHKQEKRRSVVKAGHRFTKLDVVQKWGAWCYLCGEEVLFDKSLPRAQWASLDHVVPIFVGGAHTLENCRIVHYGCNSAKGARLVGVNSHGR